MSERKDNKNGNKVLTVLGTVLCVIFGFLLICNVIIITKGTVSPEKPPSVFGTTPMVVLSGSMSGDAEDHIETGDLIFVGKADPDELKEGDVIAFMDGNVVVTHRIVEKTTDETGRPAFYTKGDANDTRDEFPVTEDNLVGIYKNRIPKVGDFAIFLQTPLGMIIFVGIPLLAFIIYDIIRRQHDAKKDRAKTKEMEKELERLRKIAGENSEEKHES